MTEPRRFLPAHEVDTRVIRGMDASSPGYMRRLEEEVLRQRREITNASALITAEVNRRIALELAVKSWLACRDFPARAAGELEKVQALVVRAPREDGDDGC